MNDVIYQAANSWSNNFRHLKDLSKSILQNHRAFTFKFRKAMCQIGLEAF